MYVCMLCMYVCYVCMYVCGCVCVCAYVRIINPGEERSGRPVPCMYVCMYAKETQTQTHPENEGLFSPEEGSLFGVSHSDIMQ